MSTSRLKDVNQGFTLVDVLVALVVMGLVGSVLVGLLAYVERNAHKIRELTHIDQGTASVGRVLRHLTEETYSVRTSGTGVVLPHGSSDAFVIATTGPRILGLSRPVRFTLRSETLGKETRIVLQWNDPSTGQEHAEIVGEAIGHASFSYFGRKGTSTERSWQSNWHQDAGRLEAVKLTLQSHDMSAPIELIAPLRADLSVQCLRDFHQRGCRLKED